MSRTGNARRLTVTLVALTLSIAVLGGGSAAAEQGWQLRFGGVLVDPDLKASVTNSDGGSIAVGNGSGTGFALGLEYRASDLVGFEVSVSQASPNVKISGETTTGQTITLQDGLRFRPYTAGVNFHLTPGRPVDLYVGALAAYVDYGDLSFSLMGMEALGVSVDSGWAWGATVGLDVGMGGAWSLNPSVTYLKTDLDARESGDNGSESFGFDPTIYRLGFGYRF